MGQKARVKIGVWVDGPRPKRGKATRDWAKEVAERTGGDLFAIVTNPLIPPDVWRSKWSSHEHLAEAVAAFQELGKEAGPMWFGVANKAAVEGLAGEIDRLADVCVKKGIACDRTDLDQEGGGSHGWGKAGVQLAPRLMGAIWQTQQRTGAVGEITVNCIPPLRGVRAQDLACIEHPACTAASLQAYSQWQAKKKWSQRRQKPTNRLLNWEKRKKQKQMKKTQTETKQKKKTK